MVRLRIVGVDVFKFFVVLSFIIFRYGLFITEFGVLSFFLVEMIGELKGLIFISFIVRGFVFRLGDRS